MKKVIDCPAAYSYSTAAINVPHETRNCDVLVIVDGVRNNQIVAEFDRSQS